MAFWQRRERGTDATDAIVDAIVAQASGVANVADTGAVRACAGLMARAFAQVGVTPANAVDAAALADMGRELVSGGVVYRLIDDGELRRVVDVQKGSTGRGAVAYKYRLALPGREPGPERRASEDRFLDVQNPSGLQTSPMFQTLAVLEKWLLDESKAPHGALIQGGGGSSTSLRGATGSGATIKLFSAYRKTLASHPGAFLPIPGSTVGAGMPAKTVGLAGNLTDEVIALHRRLSMAVCSALGVPPSLIDPAGAGGGATRETSRWFSRSTVEPLVRLVEEQLSKLDPSIKLSAAPLGGRDLVAQSRVVKSLTDAGVALDHALKLAGFET